MGAGPMGLRMGENKDTGVKKEDGEWIIWSQQITEISVPFPLQGG